MTPGESDVQLAVLAKRPIPGFAKTRLIATLGAKGAAQLQARLIRHTLTRAMDARLGRVQLWLAGEPALALEAFPAPCARYEVHQQPGGDLGERMGHIVRTAVQRGRWPILIGADCPVMTADYLQAAAAQLRAGAWAVIGPAEDGGYVLLGLRGECPGILADMPWGTSRVLDCTLERLQCEGLRYELLPTLWDLDRPDDLPRLDGIGCAQALTASPVGSISSGSS